MLKSSCNRVAFLHSEVVGKKKAVESNFLAALTRLQGSSQPNRIVTEPKEPINGIALRPRPNGVPGTTSRREILRAVIVHKNAT